MKVTLLQNARIYTGDDCHPWAEALAIVDGKVVAWDQDAFGWADAPGAIQQDLDGALVVPGMTDAHLHLMWYALSLQMLDLRDLSKAQLLARLGDRAAQTPSEIWVQGRGWDQNLWPDAQLPTAVDLDRVAPHCPVLLIAKNAHAAVANSAALHLAGIVGKVPDPEHGRFGRKADGSPDGMLFERAIDRVRAVIPEPTLPQIVDALRGAQKHLLAMGLTGIHDVDAGPAFAAFQALHHEDALLVRVVKYIQLEALDAAITMGLRSGFGDAWLRFGGLKLFADGALGARTAALLAPYEGDPDNVGVLTLEPEQLQDIAARATKSGIAMAIHAIGDRASHMILDVLESLPPAAVALRHRIEHLQLLAPSDISRLVASDVVASMQPVHATHDWQMADRYWGARTASAYPWRTLLQAGVPLAFGSDAPIESFNPLTGLYAAVTRRHEVDGTPGPAGWHPEQRLSLEQALHAYTQGAAYAAGVESTVGKLAPGFWADLVVLDRDIFRLPPEALLEAQVLRTMVAGDWRFSRGE